MSLAPTQWLALFALIERQTEALERIAAASERGFAPAPKPIAERTDCPPGYGWECRG